MIAFLCSQFAFAVMHCLASVCSILPFLYLLLPCTSGHKRNNNTNDDEDDTRKTKVEMAMRTPARPPALSFTPMLNLFLSFDVYFWSSLAESNRSDNHKADEYELYPERCLFPVAKSPY